MNHPSPLQPLIRLRELSTFGMRPPEENSLGDITPAEHGGTPSRVSKQRVPDKDFVATIAFTDHRQLLRFLLKTTAHWVLAGVVFMLFGITILRFALLPRIYTCPPGATCPHSFDPRDGQILLAIQVIMLYWLRIGCMIAGVGLVKMMAYQAAFIMKNEGSTVGTLEHSLAAIYGSATNAVRLVWTRRNLFIGLTTLGQLILFTVVPLVVGRSISDLTFKGPVRATFTYPAFFTPPRVPLGDEALRLREFQLVVVDWVMGDNNTFPLDDIHGTLDFRNNRTLYAINAQPGGFRISGTVLCSSANISSVNVPLPSDAGYFGYNITYGNQWWLTDNLYTASTFVGPLRSQIADDNSTVFIEFLWSSPEAGKIANTTQTSDGRVHISRCVHTIDLLPIAGSTLDQVQPSLLYLSPEVRKDLPWYCAGDHDDVCLKAHFGYAVLLSWGGAASRRSSRPGQLIGIWRTCRRGALTGIMEDSDPTCVVDSSSWTGALAILAEAIMKSSEKRGDAQQQLWARAKSISRTRWWLQTVIPGSELILYVLSLGYILFLNRKRDALSELSVSEVVKLAIPEQPIHDYSRRGHGIDSLWVGGRFHVVGEFHNKTYAASVPLLHPHSNEYDVTHHDQDQEIMAPADPGDNTPLNARSLRPPTNFTNPANSNRMQVALVLFHRTGPSVLFGILFMLVGIVIVRFALIPRIYACPDGASCPGSFNPRGLVLRRVQTVMLYWLQAGCLISSIGLIKVLAYLGWFGMMTWGNSIKMLEFNLAAIRGSAFRAISLVPKRSNRSLAVLAILPIIISSIVAFVVNRSISGLNPTSRVRLTFAYSSHFTLPGVQLPGRATHPGTAYSRRIANAYDKWQLGDNLSYPIDNFTSTFVTRDNRTALAVNAIPGGPRVTGTVSCSASNITSTILPAPPNSNQTSYNVTYNGRWAVVPLFWFLGSAFLEDPLYRVSILNSTSVEFLLFWITSEAGMIQNGTTTSDGKMYMAACLHTIELIPIPGQSERDQVWPSELSLSPEARNDSVPLCASGAHDDVCMAMILGRFLFQLWRGYGSDALPNQLPMFEVFCQRGAWGSFGNPSDRTCRINSTTWMTTLAGLTDALLRTSDLYGNGTQELWVDAESISRTQWWLQSVIPGATFVVYIACIGYLAYLNPRPEALKELSLSEIITAAVLAPEDIREQIHHEPVESVDWFFVGGGGHRHEEKDSQREEESD